MAVGLAGTFRPLGGSITAAIYTSIVNNAFASALPGQVTKEIAGFNFSTSNLPALLKATATDTAASYKAVPVITTPVIVAASFGC